MERSPGALGGLTFSVSRSLTVGSGVLVDMVVFLVVAGDRGRIVVTDQVPGDWLEGRGGGFLTAADTLWPPGGSFSTHSGEDGAHIILYGHSAARRTAPGQPVTQAPV